MSTASLKPNFVRKKLKYVVRLKGGAGFPEDEQGLEGREICFYKVNALGNALPSGYLGAPNDTVDLTTAIKLGAEIFEPETVVFAKVGAALLLNRFCLLQHRACIDNNMMAAIPNRSVILPRFLYWAMAPINFSDVVNPGTVPSINQSQVGQIEISLPSLDLQREICIALDRRISKLDELISKRNDFIERLKEKRTALISHVVSKGLPPAEAKKRGFPVNPNMKPTGVDWLGEIPEHWHTRRLKYVSTIFGRIGFRGYTVDDLVDEMEGAITLSPGNMSQGKFNFTKCTYISWEKYEESPEIKIESGDIVIVKTGSTFGKVAMIEKVHHPMTINPQLAIFKNVTCNRRFLFHYLNSAALQGQISLSNTGGTIPTMTQNTIGNYAIPLPPIEEQVQIASYIDSEIFQIDALVSKVEEAIRVLTEYRSALITSAVTGKVDVREAAK